MTNAYKYLIKLGGLEEESAYPYSGKIGQCTFDSSKIAVKVKKGRRENSCKINTNSHMTNRTGVCVVLCANLKMFCSQKRTEHTNCTHSHNANRTTMPRENEREREIFITILISKIY